MATQTLDLSKMTADEIARTLAKNPGAIPAVKAAGRYSQEVAAAVAKYQGAPAPETTSCAYGCTGGCGCNGSTSYGGKLVVNTYDLRRLRPERPWARGFIKFTITASPGGGRGAIWTMPAQTIELFGDNVQGADSTEVGFVNAAGTGIAMDESFTNMKVANCLPNRWPGVFDVFGLRAQIMTDISTLDSVMDALFPIPATFNAEYYGNTKAAYAAKLDEMRAAATAYVIGKLTGDDEEDSTHTLGPLHRWNDNINSDGSRGQPRTFGADMLGLGWSHALDRNTFVSGLPEDKVLRLGNAAGASCCNCQRFGVSLTTAQKHGGENDTSAPASAAPVGVDPTLGVVGVRMPILVELLGRYLTMDEVCAQGTQMIATKKE